MRRQRNADGERSGPSAKDRAGDTPPGPSSCGGKQRVAARWLVIVLGACVGGAGLSLLIGWMFPRFTRIRDHDAIAATLSQAQPEMAAVIEETCDLVDRLRGDYAESPDVLEVMALLHCRFGSSDEAVRCYELAVELDPAFYRAWHGLGMIAQSKGDHRQAAEYYLRTLELDPTSARTAMEAADSLRASDQLDRAAGVLKQALAADPTLLPLRTLLGELQVQRKEYEEGLRTLEEADRLGMDLPSGYYAMATACSRLGKPEEAKRCQERFRRLRAEFDQAHREETAGFEPLADVRRQAAEVFCSAGNVYLDRDAPDLAESCWKRASELCPELVEPRQMLAKLYEVQQRNDEALVAWRELRRQAPKNSAGHAGLAALAARLGRDQEAEDALRKLIEVGPNRPEPYAALAAAYLKSDRRLSEARNLAGKAVDLNPTAANLHLLGMACLRNGDPAAARSAIERAAAIEPDNAVYREALESLR